jgi:hypothetical protein
MSLENIKPSIQLLAKRVLTDDELRAVFCVVEKYRLEQKEGVKAFYYLDATLGLPRKDPISSIYVGGIVEILSITDLEESWNRLENALIYCRYFVSNTDLTQTSRDFVRRSCDYVENATKYLLSSLDSEADLKHPLGNIVNALKKTEYDVPKQLLEDLEDFNRIVYRVAKHEYDLPQGQHLYTPDEALVIYFTAKKLGSAVRTLVKLPPGFSLARHKP